MDPDLRRRRLPRRRVDYIQLNLLDIDNTTGKEQRGQPPEITAMRTRVTQITAGHFEARRRACVDPVWMYFRHFNTCNYECQWCFQFVRSSPSSARNLLFHRDGCVRGPTIHPSCPARWTAENYGCNLPQAADAAPVDE
ncbi:hypothetical protein Pst134EA_024327 [Puccinia striiformis f. sp. tritici]|uniref:hypothetical protein n=1 Tax=Puccinia striiformis f. sp. tritici TaxID=168172 RepID=UPI002007677B|nr:hypothetical protein Pst134EA_024327 [Puccinia striiformis f. sp. tritici]KAH9453451.1 hypothetical protein Pst134EA_024327 [Puccinia striiformis f. sp. tritici]